MFAFYYIKKAEIKHPKNKKLDHGQLVVVNAIIKSRFKNKRIDWVQAIISIVFFIISVAIGLSIINQISNI